MKKNEMKSKVIKLYTLIFILTSLSMTLSQVDSYNYNSGYGTINNPYLNYNNPYGSSNYNQYNSEYNSFGNTVNPQLYPPGYSGFSYTSPTNYWSGYGSEQCISGQDLILQIAPGGCKPSVVRSDLLEEQNVPVFCKVMAIQVNPLIDISRIRSINVRGQYPKGVSGISYYPARVAVGGKQAFGNSIFDDNLGYVVIVLSRQPNEKEMPDFVEGNVSAIVDYETEASFGIGDPSFYLSEITDSEWANNYRDYGFWNGKGYIRVESIEDDSATVSVYRDFDTRQATVTIREGQTSNDIFLSGFYCAAGLRLKIEDIRAPIDSALLQINGVQTWVAKGDKIMDDKCRVVGLETNAGGGKITIKCPGKEAIELSLIAGNAVFSYEGNEFFNKAVGEEIKDKIYLGYIGQSLDNKRYAILIKDDSSDSEGEFRGRGVIEIIEKEISDKRNYDENKKRIESKIKDHYENLGLKDNVTIGVIVEREKFFGIRFDEANIAQDINFDYEKLTEQQKLSKEYYDLSINDYDNLFKYYPNEKMEFIEEDPYAAKGLLESAQLSKMLGLNAKAYEYYNKLLEEYPNSNSASVAKFENRNLLKYDNSKSQASVSIMNQNYFVNVLNFKKPDKKELNAVVFIDGKEKTLGLKESVVVNKNGYLHSFKLVYIGNDYIDVEYERNGGDLTNSDIRKQRLSFRDDQDSFNGINIKLIKINSNKQVKLVVLSKGYGPRAESNFRFRIGIEKRAIQISPEKAKEMMNSLKESIKMWESVNRKLGNVVRGLKGACFATSAVLTTKNIITGYSGASLARNLIMRNSGGWNDKCEELVNNKVYDTLHQCLLAHSNEIEKDVEIYSNNIKDTNTIINKIKDSIGFDEGLFDKEKINTKKIEEEFKKVFDEWCKNKNEKIVLPNSDKTEVELGNSDKSICKWETLTHEQRRDIMTLYNAKNSGGSETLVNMTSRDLGRILLEGKNYNDEYSDIINSEKDANKFNLGIKTTEPIGDSITQGFIKTITLSDNSHKIYSNFTEGDKVVRIFIPKEKTIGGQSVFKIEDPKILEEIGGKQVIVEMIFSEKDNYYYPKEKGKVFLINGNQVSEGAADEVRRYMDRAGLNKIKQSDKKSYQNRMIHPERLRVKYFERAPYKGLPAEIPFDIENGWYVEMTYVLSGFGKPYDESGRVTNYYICNVGGNGLIEFKKSSDDICRYYNEHNPDISFPGLTLDESRELVTKARNAITEAARQYGKSKVTINGKNFDSGISFGGEEGKCTDFMSAKDCTFLFNVCDPVICPASRCDFGGRYRVDNVIQSGVAGSLLLCLPNYKEGVVVPICLSGVHAGIDGYTSILNSTVDCLNESLQTGRNVGICDEIKSIYICEFFWRQAAPLAEIAVPRLFESITGQTRGGGEYLTIQNAWDNTQNAINYFSEVYAINSIRAFSNRNIDYAGGEVGTDICKSFISANYGGLNGFFRALIEPDSPVQYHAWFSESPMTTATVPPISHYKVYYHIYAGKDIGAYYVVYLRDVSQTQGINILGQYVVDRGYITRGQSVDRARDFIATSGFKQLCVNINGRDECGFGRVSTSYALNSLSESFVAEQIRTGITSEKECIAGTPSFGSLITPNIQSGVSEILNPEIYNKGIIRVCASDNPGKQVLPSGEYDRTNSSYDQWKVVGYCDDPTIKCWLDTNSVKEVIIDKGLENQVLDNINKSNIGEINYWTYEQSRSVADRAERFIRELKIVKEDDKRIIDAKIRPVVIDLINLSNMGTTNVHRARAHYLLGNIYKKISEELWKGKTNGSENLIYEDLKVDEIPIENPVIENKEENIVIETTYPIKLTYKLNSDKYKLDDKKKIIDNKGEYTGFYLEEDSSNNINVKQTTLFIDRLVGKVENNKLDFTDFTSPSKRWPAVVYSLQGLEIIKESFQEKSEQLQENKKENAEKSKFILGNDNKILYIGGRYAGYYLREIIYDREQDIVEYSLMESKPFFDKRVGELVNDRIFLTVPLDEWTDVMKELNGLEIKPKRVEYTPN